jgi:hypothetical protein
MICLTIPEWHKAVYDGITTYLELCMDEMPEREFQQINRLLHNYDRTGDWYYLAAASDIINYPEI